ncbi:MAG: hypothetical protein IT184_13015 [Acidobacteria bacterium]|nr:hypothetical protein [Acidobacteriota bacterium]
MYQAPAASAGGRAIDRLAIVSWNVHVGGGDLAALVAGLREGRLTGGEPVADFVLLLHEAFRGGAGVPADLPAGVPVPRRIAPGPPSGRRLDVVRTARALGLGVFYVPSMRNGDDEKPAEDRGNAILSTLPFDALAGVELPHARQRRVAISAVVHGFDADARPWRLRLVSAHLNATAGPDRLWIFASGLRERQARHLIDALGEDATPTVVGSDLNTWAGGFREPAFVELQRRFPETDPAAGGAMFRGGPRLDFVFFGLPASWQGRVRPLADRFGSDHHPLVGWISVRDG